MLSENSGHIIPTAQMDIPRWDLQLRHQNNRHQRSNIADSSAHTEHPYQLKAQADREISLGTNRFHMHDYCLQPVETAYPGMTASLVLQSGTRLTDVAAFWGEEMNNGGPISYNSPYSIPVSYKQDVFSRADLLQLVAKDGKAVLAQLLALTNAGVPMLLQPTTPSRGLGSNDTDTEVAALATELWGLAGNGKVFVGNTSASVLTSIGLEPDFTFTSPSNDAALYFERNLSMLWATSGTPQIWDPMTEEVTPVIWSTALGRTEFNGYVFYPPVSSTYGKGHSAAGLYFALNSLELVEASTSTPTIIATVPGYYTGDWTHIAIVPTANLPTIYVNGTLVYTGTASSNIVHPNVDSKDSTTIMLHRFSGDIAGVAHPDFDVAHFSGTATYTTTFSTSHSSLPGTNKRLLLTLGSVENMAEVSLNSHDLGISWLPPYEIDITSAVRAGTNELSTAVTNLWVNRLVGDQNLPVEDVFNSTTQNFAIEAWLEWWESAMESGGAGEKAGERVTFAAWKHYNATAPLLASGLLGPVTLIWAVMEELESLKWS
ncbi:uncharacterized protein PAC_11748 [Phialocephala subalpina]|uniref:Uncharacterized protein n=1 Tax=Phialocephala subalpina TaxID=576137 RepID=A0A1L7XA01_9HELO|nr:uncharacterized protein PAC_11748 [Phialocephala subalpina]